MSSESGAAAPDDDPEVDFQAVDVDELVRQERVRAIFDAKRECREYRLESQKYHKDDAHTASMLYRNALESYIREVEPLFAQTENGRVYWNQHDFGTVDLRPRGAEHHLDASDMVDGPGAAEIPVRGLSALFSLSPPFRATWDVVRQSKRLGKGYTTNREDVNREVPFHILDEMYAVVNGYLSEIGFGIKIDQAQQHTKFDDDLVDELREWREENL